MKSFFFFYKESQEIILDIKNISNKNEIYEKCKNIFEVKFK